MNKKTTKDELFLLKLYQMGSELGDVTGEVDLFQIAKAIGQNDKGAAVIARDLAQANFIKKAEGQAVYLSDHGLRFVRTFLEDCE